MILTPYGVPFHPVVVIGLGKNLLFKSVLAHCEVAPSILALLINFVTFDEEMWKGYFSQGCLLG